MTCFTGHPLRWGLSCCFAGVEVRSCEIVEPIYVTPYTLKFLHTPCRTSYTWRWGSVLPTCRSRVKGVAKWWRRPPTSSLHPKISSYPCRTYFACRYMAVVFVPHICRHGGTGVARWWSRAPVSHLHSKISPYSMQDLLYQPISGGVVRLPSLLAWVYGCCEIVQRRPYTLKFLHAPFRTLHAVVTVEI
jgi:hypothetical protein